MRPIFKRTLGDENDKLVLGLAFLVGITLIITFRLIGWNWFAISSATSVIILYTVYIFFTKNRAGISVDRASDNAYYLGLIFTLISLCYSLIKLQNYNSNISENITENRFQVLDLLPDFGLALFSTISGIMCRIILQQMRNDPLDVETEAREELGVAVRQLKSSITTVTGNLNTLSEATSLSLKELNNKVANVLEQTADDNAKTIKKVTDNLTRLGEESEGQVSKISNFSSKVLEEISTVLTALTKEMKEISEAPKEFQKSLEELSLKFNIISENSETTSEKQLELAASLQDMASKLKKIFSDKDFSEIGTFAKETSSRLQSLNEDIEVSGEEIKKKSKDIKSAVNIISKEGKTVANDMKAIEDATKNYANEIEKANERIKNLRLKK